MSLYRLLVLFLAALMVSVPSAAQSSEASSSDTTATAENSRFKRTDPHGTRLFFKPTARPAGQGSVAISTTNIFLPQVLVGITDAITVEAGVLVEPNYVGDLFVLTPSVQVLDRDRVRVALTAGAYAARETDLAFSTHPGGSFQINVTQRWHYGVTPRAVLTYGTDVAAVTASVGVPLAIGDIPDDLGPGLAVVSAGGGAQVLNWLKLVTENDVTLGVPYRIPVAFGSPFSGPADFVYERGRMVTLHTLSGVRFFWNHFAIDVGGGVLTASKKEFNTRGSVYLRFSYAF